MARLSAIYFRMFCCLAIMATTTGCQQADQSQSVDKLQSEDESRAALAQAETDWLAAYTNIDTVAMDRFLADGFKITFSDGRIQTRDDVIDMIRRQQDDPPADSLPEHYTEGRTILLLGETAILSGVYVYPRANGTESRSRYTDTWMYLDGRWQVVVSHLSRDSEE